MDRRRVTAYVQAAVGEAIAGRQARSRVRREQRGQPWQGMFPRLAHRAARVGGITTITNHARKRSGGVVVLPLVFRLGGRVQASVSGVEDATLACTCYHARRFRLCPPVRKYFPFHQTWPRCPGPAMCAQRHRLAPTLVLERVPALLAGMFPHKVLQRGFTSDPRHKTTALARTARLWLFKSSWRLPRGSTRGDSPAPGLWVGLAPVPRAEAGTAAKEVRELALLVEPTKGRDPGDAEAGV